MSFKTLSNKIVNMIISIMYFIFSFIIAVWNNDSLNKSENYLCRKDCSIEIWLNILKFILLLTYLLNLPQGYNNAITLVSSVIIIGLAYQQIRRQVFYNKLIGIVFGSCLICYIKVILFGITTLIWQKYARDFAISYVFCFSFTFLFFSALYSNREWIFIRKKLLDIKDTDELIAFIDALEVDCAKCVIGDQMSISRITGYIYEHKRTWADSNLMNTEGELYLPLINKTTTIQKNPKIADICRDEIFLIHLIKEVFMILGTKFHGEPKFHFAYACFLLYKFGNIKLALIEIEKSKKFSYTVQQEFSLYILKHIANKRLINSQYYIANYVKQNISILDILDVIVFEELSMNLEEEIHECAKTKAEFWKLFHKKKIFIEDLYKKGTKYIQTKNNVEKIWRQMRLITNQNKHITNLYNEYLNIVCDNKVVIKEEKTKTEDEDEVDDIVDTRFYEDVIIFIISTDISNELGNIHYTSKNIAQFGYSQNDLVGKNISVVQPEGVGKAHNEILVNYLETGKTKIIGNNTTTFIKTKTKFIKQINLFVLPIPSYNNKNEAVGLIRENPNTNYYILFNEFGIIDSYTQNFKNFGMFDKDTIEKNDVDLFIFYIFPFLLTPLENMGNLPLFLHENSLLENSQCSFCGYFNRNLPYILSDIKDKILNNKFSGKKRRNAVIDNVNKDSSSVAYSEYCKMLIKLKEYMKNQNNKSNCDQQLSEKDIKNTVISSTMVKRTRNNFNFESKFGYFDAYQAYKTFLEEEVSRGDIIKKNFNCKMSSMVINKDNKMYIMELSIQPSDNDETKKDMSDDEKDKTEQANLYKVQTQQQQKQQPPGIDENLLSDTSSVSSGSKTTINSVHALIQKIRDEKHIDSTFHKASYMNLLFYFYLIALLTYTIYYVIYVNQLTDQLDVILDGKFKYIQFIEQSFILRSLSHLERQRIKEKVNIPNLEIYDINDTLALNAANMLITSKEISDILFKISNQKYVNRIVTMFYPGDLNTTMTEVEKSIIKNNIYITDPSSLSNTEFSEILREGLGIEIAGAQFTIEAADREEKIEYISQHTRNTFFQLVENKLLTLRELFDKNINTYKKFIKFSTIGMNIILFIVMVLVFFMLRKMYKINKGIMEKMIIIKKEDITEMIQTVEEFKKSMNCDDDSRDENNDDLSTEIDISENASLIENEVLSNSKKENKKAAQAKPGSKERVNKTSLEKKETKMVRRQKIFCVFSMNIFYVIIVIVTFFVISYLVGDHLITKTLLYYDFVDRIESSAFQNLLNYNIIRDTFISNDKIQFSEYNNEEYIRMTFELMKEENLYLISFYSQHEKEFRKETAADLDSIFYTNLCELPLSTIDCEYSDFPQFNFTNVFFKGMKYAIDYFSNQIDMMLNVYKTKLKTEYITYFSTENDIFITTFILYEHYLKKLYLVILSISDEGFDKNSREFIIFAIVISVICIVILLCVICFGWLKYSNRIRMEEFMSIKLIAEIPIHVISKNNEILSFLKSYVVNNNKN